MGKRSAKILDPASYEVDENLFSSPSSSDSETGADDIFESEDIIQQRVQLFKAADKYRRKPTLQLPKSLLSSGGSLIASTCAAKDKCSDDLNKCVTVGCKQNRSILS